MKTKTRNLIKKAIGLATICLIALLVTSFVISKATQPKTAHTSEGKAWWCSYYTKNSKTIYITKAYNNDCNHCQNEIAVAFEKWLILNDYDNHASTRNMISINDVTKANIEERREKYIIDRKQKGYSVINVGFTFTEN